MSEVAYVLCMATAVLCAILLRRSYRITRGRLVLWASLCFIALAINNAAVVLDVMLLPSVDLRLLRGATALVGMLLLVYGLIWERE